MTYEEFLNFVHDKCMYETIYDDSEGRNILVIKMLDAYDMVNKAQRPWVGLTDNEADEVYMAAQEQINEYWESGGSTIMFPTMLYKAIESKLKEKNK